MHSIQNNLKTLATIITLSGSALPSLYANQDGPPQNTEAIDPAVAVIENSAAFENTLDRVNSLVKEQTLDVLKLAKKAIETYLGFKTDHPETVRPEYQKTYNEIVPLIKTLRDAYLKLDYQSVQSGSDLLKSKSSQLLDAVEKDLKSIKIIDAQAGKIDAIAKSFGPDKEKIPTEVIDAQKATQELRAKFNQSSVTSEETDKVAELVYNAPTYEAKVAGTVGIVFGSLVGAVILGAGGMYIVPRIKDSLDESKRKRAKEQNELESETRIHMERIVILFSNKSALQYVLDQNPNDSARSQTHSYCSETTKLKLQTVYELTCLALDAYQSNFESVREDGIDAMKVLSAKVESQPFFHDQRQISFLNIGVRDPFLKFLAALSDVTDKVLRDYEKELGQAAA